MNISERKENNGMENIISCLTNAYHNFSLEDALKGISRAGFCYVELLAEPIRRQWVHPDMPLKPLKEKLTKNCLKVSSLSAPSDFLQDEGRDYFKKCLELTKKLNARIINTPVGEPKNEKETKTMLKNLKNAASYAESLGMIMALEPHGDITSTGQKVLEIVNKLDSAAVKINYDTANVIFYGNVNPEDDLPLVVSQVAHLHIKDKRGGYKKWDFPALGKGRINFPAIFRILQLAHYQGPLSVEIEFAPGGSKNLKEIDEAVQESFVYLKRLFK
ncbi:MAG: sugar phosphate isomerase/epimerase family protein [bacterium]